MLLVSGHQLSKVLVEHLFYMINFLVRGLIFLWRTNKFVDQVFVRLYLILD